jgi:MFS superfamily sulfate permease-like transporter
MHAHTHTLTLIAHASARRNLERFEDAKEIEGCKIFRFGAALNFANKDYFEHNLNRLLMGKVRCVCVCV